MIPTPEEGKEYSVHVEYGLRLLLQLAVDEMLHMVEAVDHNHETKLDHLKYGTPYGAVNGLRKVREDILVQAAVWGIALSPHRAVPIPEEGTEPAGRLEGGLEAAISQPGRSEKSPQGGAGAAVSSSTQPSADAAGHETRIATIIANHLMDEFEWPRTLAEQNAAQMASTIMWAAVERLRSALRCIADHEWSDDATAFEALQQAYELREVARAVLSALQEG